MANGQDEHPVATERETKSVSAETTLAEDVSELEDLRAIVRRVSERVARHMEGSGLQGRTVTLKLRLSDFTTFTRQVTLAAPVSEGVADLRGRAGHTRTGGDAGAVVPADRRRGVALRAGAGEPAAGVVWGGVRGG